MTNVVMVPSSNMPPAPIKPQEQDAMKPSEAIKLKQAFEEIMVNDPRCIGLSRYIANVRIFWSYSIPTACAGHGFIFFNPNFYDSIPEETRITVCVHEIWHLILKHLERGKNMDPRIHNIAADHAINIALEDDGFTFEGTEPYKDKRYRGQSTEQIYKTIYEAEKQTQKPTPGSMGGYVPADVIEDLIEQVVQDENSTLEKQKEKAEDDINKSTLKPGGVSGNQSILLHDSNSKQMILDATYQEIFKDYLTDPLSGGKRSFMYPNRRQHSVSKKLILPGRSKRRGVKNRLTHLVYALDVSGSINSKQANQFHTSVKTIKELLNPESLTVLFFDTKIRLEKTFTDRENYGELKVVAGGGTDLRDVYKRTAQLKPEALVIFTDLCVTIPPKPEWECIWLVPEAYYGVPKNIYGKVYCIPDQN